MSDGTARVRLFAQIGDHALLFELVDTTIASQAQMPELLRAVADTYAEQFPDLPGLPSAP